MLLFHTPEEICKYMNIDTSIILRHLSYNNVRSSLIDSVKIRDVNGCANMFYLIRLHRKKQLGNRLLSRVKFLRVTSEFSRLHNIRIRKFRGKLSGF
jgi:hypothetical protein